MTQKTLVKIHYCTGCRWMLRAAWMAQEMLVTFEADLEAVSLHPSGGGMFKVVVDDQVVWDRATEGRFPDIKELKQRIRDQIDPERSLGHSDR